MRAKLFRTVHLSAKNAQDSENEMNDWLRQNPEIRVVDIKQSATGSTFAGFFWLISVWYEEGAGPNG
jgi:hypothetical protein